MDPLGFCRIKLDTSKQDTLDLVSAEEIVEATYAICRGEQHAILTDGRDVAGVVTPQAREYMSSAAKMVQIRKASAIVTNSLANKLIANFYIRVNKPLNPTRVFNNESDAVHWLRQFI